MAGHRLQHAFEGRKEVQGAWPGHGAEVRSGTERPPGPRKHAHPCTAPVDLGEGAGDRVAQLDRQRVARFGPIETEFGYLWEGRDRLELDERHVSRSRR